LIRPDGYVGARWTSLPKDPRQVLEAALVHILDLPASRST
jgi:hypothetical protein